MTQRLSLWNAISLAVMLSANVLANTVPIGGRTTGEISDAYAHLFAPTGFTFAIWGLIYVLLLAWVVDQLVRAWSGSSTPSLPLQAVGMLFVLSSLANTGWILAWHHDYMFLSALLTLALLLTVFCIYTLVHRPRLPFRSPAERWLTQLPFRVYAGWVSVALMANITVVLVDRGWQGWGLSEVF